MRELTLIRRGSPLADPAHQLRILSPAEGQAPFERALSASGHATLCASGIRVLQINLGKLCNQTCRHCHVDAGPDRREIMDRKTIDRCLEVLAHSDIPVVDLTGGAPEMNPHFRWLVTQARQLGRHVIDRSNLTILLAPGFDDLPEFLAENRVEIVASLPCYLESNTDAQRGAGVFEKSIAALHKLNALGYGREDSGLTLTLVFNPQGPVLPPAQASLEETYRRELDARYGIVFNRLYTVTNMPISRFLDDLLASGQYASYLQKLIEAYNPATVDGLMCRDTVSVGWDGQLFDCDFNQMLGLGVAPGVPSHINDWDADALAERRIVTAQHCYGCTAGSGSSCQGAIA